MDCPGDPVRRRSNDVIVRQPVLVAQRELDRWVLAAQSRRLSFNSWVRCTVEDYLDDPYELPLDRPPHEVQALFRWSQDDRALISEFARANGYASLGEFLRRVLSSAAARLLERRQHRERRAS